MLGVSYLATSVFNQYKSAVNNGLLHAEYLYGVNITASKKLHSVNSGISSYRFLSEAQFIDSSGNHAVPYYLANQCRSQNSIYTRIVLEHPNPIAVSSDLSGNKWINNPKLNGIDGAVGAVENMVASGLLSDQIYLAIKRAAIQLAFEKHSNVSEQSIQIMRTNGGIIQISNITENTKVKLKARVLKIHFDKKPGEHVRVYVWLAAIS